MGDLNKCINAKYKCYCNKMRECKECSGNHIVNGKCELTVNDFCTCRNCGNAVRSDGYKYSSDN